MDTPEKRRGGDLFIVDNGDKDWKVIRYLHDWADLAHTFDIATGYFEIGSLLALDGQWQKLDKLRILMGDEVSKRTRKTLVDGTRRITTALDASIENEKEVNDFLVGVPGILDALQKRKIECRVYTKEKFHAKAYITHAKQAVVGSSALVGSSNFTLPGLTNNVELNVQIRREVEELQAWYERHWEQADDVTNDVLRVIERHTREYGLRFSVPVDGDMDSIRNDRNLYLHRANCFPNDGTIGQFLNRTIRAISEATTFPP
jgi:phosphatidylserine/phosphatidylglycerophosphate/cardiolipin synthase-like enzyme